MYLQEILDEQWRLCPNYRRQKGDTPRDPRCSNCRNAGIGGPNRQPGLYCQLMLKGSRLGHLHARCNDRNICDSWTPRHPMPPTARKPAKANPEGKATP